ncbi:unnamed protein product [Prorocentrum cordatum]|uniref:Uncharacterized protein n=1 Tax=Prorocentrum cordatum TaxID=2364126 RepID=A0ABN9PHH0_9DINO|nr:unnamed protein product [Polarella glacialis]
MDVADVKKTMAAPRSCLSSIGDNHSAPPGASWRRRLDGGSTPSGPPSAAGPAWHSSRARRRTAGKWEDKVQSSRRGLLWQAYRQIHQLTAGVRREAYCTEGVPATASRLNASY